MLANRLCPLRQSFILIALSISRAMKNVIHASQRIKQLMKDMNPKITMKNVKMLLKVNDRDLLMQKYFFSNQYRYI